MTLRPHALLALAPLLLAGCLTHLPPPRGHCQLLIHWSPDYAAAAERAQAEHKAILMVLAAGELDGPC